MFDIIVFVFSLTLLHLHIYNNGTIPEGVLKLIFIVPLYVVIIKNLFIKREWQFGRWMSENKLLIIFVVIVIIAHLRAYLTGTSTAKESFFDLMIFCTVTMFALSLVADRKIEDDKRLMYLFCSVSTYVLVNVIMQSIGLVSPVKRVHEMFSAEMGNALTLESVGIKTPRILFPLANGLNNFGVVCGVSLVFWSIILLKKNHSWQGYTVIILFVTSSLLALLFVDSRGPLLFWIMSTILMFLLPSKRKRFVLFVLIALPFVIPALYFSMDFLISAMNSLNISVLDSFSRGNASDVQQFAGRAIVWQSAFDNLSQFSILHLVGYGWYGQAASGITRNYYHFALLFVNPDRVSLHNSYLQYIYDIGYLGLLVFMILYYRTTKKVIVMKSGVNDAVSLATLGTLVYMALVGLFEVNLSMAGDESVYIMMSVLVYLSNTSGS